MEGAEKHVGHFAGSYVSTRRAFTSFEKLMGLLMGTEEITANPGGTLQFHDTRYVQVEPIVFRGIDCYLGVLVFCLALFLSALI